MLLTGARNLPMLLIRQAFVPGERYADDSDHRSVGRPQVF